MLPEKLKENLINFVDGHIQPDDEATQLTNNKRRSSTKVYQHIDEVTKDAMVNYLKENKELWLKILTFKKLNMKDLHKEFSSRGVVIEFETMQEFLSSLGVLYGGSFKKQKEI